MLRAVSRVATWGNWPRAPVVQPISQVCGWVYKWLKFPFYCQNSAQQHASENTSWNTFAKTQTNNGTMCLTFLRTNSRSFLLFLAFPLAKLIIVGWLRWRAGSSLKFSYTLFTIILAIQSISESLQFAIIFFLSTMGQEIRRRMKSLWLRTSFIFGINFSVGRHKNGISESKVIMLSGTHKRFAYVWQLSHGWIKTTIHYYFNVRFPKWKNNAANQCNPNAFFFWFSLHK